MILIAAFLFLQRTNRPNGTSPNGSTPDSLDVQTTIDPHDKPLSNGTPRPRDPAYSCPNPTDVDMNHSTERNWYRPRPSYQAYQDSDREQPHSEHPHAVIEEAAMERIIQAGVLGAHSVSQHPHALVEGDGDRM